MSDQQIEYLVIWKHMDTGEWHVDVMPTLEDAHASLRLMIAIGHKAAGITFRHQAEPSAILEIATHA